MREGVRYGLALLSLVRRNYLSKSRKSAGPGCETRDQALEGSDGEVFSGLSGLSGVRSSCLLELDKEENTA